MIFSKKKKKNMSIEQAVVDTGNWRTSCTYSFFLEKKDLHILRMKMVGNDRK